MFTIINDIIHNVKDVVSEITNLSVNDMDSMPDYQAIFKTITNGLLLVSKEETKQLEAKIIFLENSRQPLIIKEAYFREWLCQFLPEISVVNIYDVLNKTKKFPSINIEPSDKNDEQLFEHLINRVVKEFKRTYFYGDKDIFELGEIRNKLKYFYSDEKTLTMLLKLLKKYNTKEIYTPLNDFFDVCMTLIDREDFCTTVGASILEY